MNNIKHFDEFITDKNITTANILSTISLSSPKSFKKFLSILFTPIYCFTIFNYAVIGQRIYLCIVLRLFGR